MTGTEPGRAAIPDRTAIEAQQTEWASSCQAPAYGGEQGLPTHQDEMAGAESGLMNLPQPPSGPSVGKGALDLPVKGEGY